MSTLVISGGTDGIGRGLALHYLRAGHEVAVIGRSEAKFRELLAAAGGRGSAHLVRADLALAAGNRHAVAELTARFATIDALVLCAAYVRTRRTLTAEGLEHTFALYYLSRYLLSHGLADRLEAADRPVILNTAVPGAPGDAIHWNDLQLSRSFTARRANHQSRRANHLLGLMLTTRPAARIRHILYNPGFVATSHAGALNRPTRALVTTLTRLAATPVDKAIHPLHALITTPPAPLTTAYHRDKPLPLPTTPIDTAEATRLHATTEILLTTLPIPENQP